jgi:hypothetical protein
MPEACAMRWRDVTARDRALVHACALAGVAVRIWYQHGRSFVGDEVGSLRWIEMPYGFLLTHFMDPWLSMNVYLAGLKALDTWSGRSTWVLIAPSLLASAATVVLTATLALRTAGPQIAVASAMLVAFNPYLVGFGVQIRSYMPYTACALAALVAALDWRAERTARRGVACAAWFGAATLLHLNAAYLLPGLAVAALHGDGRAPGRLVWDKELRTLVVPLAVAGLVVGLAYLPMAPDLRAVRAQWSEPAPSRPDALAWIAGAWLGGGWRGLPASFLTGLGLWYAVENRRSTRVLIGVVVLPIVAMSFTGVSHYPWGWARFLLPVLPALLVFTAAGAQIATRGRWTSAALAVGVVWLAWVPVLQAEKDDQRRFPWRTVAAHLDATLRDGDWVVEDGPGHASLLVSATAVERVAKYGSIRRYLRRPKGAGRLVLLDAGEPLRTNAPQVRFGQIQIVVYDARDRETAAAVLEADLVRTLGTRVAPELSGLYGLLLEVRAARGRGDPGAQLTRRFYESSRRTRTWRWMPLAKLPGAED